MARPKKAPAILEDAEEISVILSEDVEFDEEEEKFSEADIADIAELAEEIIKDARSESFKASTSIDPFVEVLGGIQDLKTSTTSIAMSLSRITDVAIHLGFKELGDLVNERFSELLSRMDTLSARMDSLEKPKAAVKEERAATTPTPTPEAATIRSWLCKLPKGSQYSLSKIATTISAKLGLTEKEVASIVCDQTDIVVVIDGQVRVKGL